tara:strand:+ start:226 stop:1194 length:969 start_codon:yes stop_codon:yes gene_type:complete
MPQYKKITVFVFTFLFTNIIWSGDVIFKKHPKKNNSVRVGKGFNQSINNKYAYVLYYENEVFFRDGINDKWKKVMPHDELNIDGEIKIDNENGLILLEIDSQKIKIKGFQKTKKIIEIIKDQKIEKKSNNESSPFMNFFLEPDNFKKTKVGSVERSLIEETKLCFHPKSSKKINVLKNTYSMIFWEKDPDYNDEYKIQISHYFNPKIDTFLLTRDTSMTINQSLISECHPCEIKIVEPKDRYPEITMTTKEFTIEQEKIYKSLLKKINDENDIYSRVILINMMAENNFHNTAFYYINKFHVENPTNKYFQDEYQYYIQNLLQ